VDLYDKAVLGGMSKGAGARIGWLALKDKTDAAYLRLKDYDLL
jgi:hypothetical protein